MSARLAVDIGGTFTDVVLEMDDKAHAIKVLTTTDAPERGVIEGVRPCWRKPGARRPRSVVHGTTLATNALIERKGARTALVTTAGFAIRRDRWSTASSSTTSTWSGPIR